MIKTSWLSAFAFVFVLAAIATSSQSFAYDDHAVLHSTDGEVVTSSFGACVRTQWDADRDECAPQVVAQTTITAVKKPYRHKEIDEEQRTVYFAFNKTVLTPEAKTKLDSLTQVLKSEEDVKEAKIVGYADRIGSIKYNDRLSQKRAETVKNYIVAHGYANASVAETRWLGKTAPITNCSSKLKRTALIRCLQQDRRVEVEIDYAAHASSNNQ